MEREEGISKRDYARLCALIYSEAGIHLGQERQTMLEIRIKRRIKALGMAGYAEYCEFLFGARGRDAELVPLIDVVTTNKTDFFREPKHFEYLTATALPDLGQRGSGEPLRVWSAGCSTGEEPYTLAMVLSEYGEAHPGFRFRILATDISTAVLEKARLGVYGADTLIPVPETLRRKYFLRSRDRSADRARVAPELRRHVVFRRLNFIDEDYGLQEKVDAIFCRNVIIYFDHATQERILRRLARCLAAGGYLFVGHAETLHTMSLPLQPVAPALYKRLSDGT